MQASIKMAEAPVSQQDKPKLATMTVGKSTNIRKEVHHVSRKVCEPPPRLRLGRLRASD